MKINSLSVFFPCINEEGNIENIVAKAQTVLDSLKLKYEIIIIDDGSTDKTGEIADKLAKTNSNIRVIHHPKNLGYGEALKSGFYNARYETIVYTDGDSQFDFAEVTKFIDQSENSDLVIGYRIKRQDSLLRILFKKGWTFSLWLFFGLTLKDVDCGFKMVKQKVLQKIPHLESSRGAMINAELAISAKKAGFKIAQVGVQHYPRTAGKPTGASLNVIFKSYTDLIKLWWKLKDQKILFISLIAILLLAASLRFYKLSEYMTFLGDEGRDALVIRDLLINHHLPFIGPPSSVGNIYLGPLYYYMMAIPMFIFWLNPVAAAGMNALIGVATVALIYYLGKLWFNRYAGLTSAFLYAISPVTINYSKSSWNPNPTAFFVLIAIISFNKLHQSRNYMWLILTGAMLAAALQMHYLCLILMPIFSIFWLYEAIIRKSRKNIVSGTLMGIFSFVLVMLPLILFDFKHDFLNYRAFVKLFTQGSDIKVNVFANVVRIPSIFSINLIGRYMAGSDLILIFILSAVILLALFKKSWPVFVLGVWLIVGLFGLSFYQPAIFDHYLNFLNPTPFLLFGSLFAFKINNKNLKQGLNIFLIILILILTYVNIQKSPLKNPPNNQLKKTQDIARFILDKTQGKDYNFALIAKNNYDSAYKFYLDLYGNNLKIVPFDKTDQLFVVCEDVLCDPTHNSKEEIAAYGYSKIDWEQDQFGVKIFKLSHNPDGKPQ